MIHFDLKQTDYEGRSIEDILWQRCKLKIAGKTPRQLIIAIAKNYIAECSRMGYIASFGRWANHSRHWYFCKRIMEWLGVEVESKEGEKLAKYFRNVIKKRYPQMYPTYKRPQKSAERLASEAPKIRSVSLYYYTLYRISASDNDGQIIFGDYYINEWSDEYTEFFIDPAYNRKLSRRLGPHSVYKWYRGTPLTCLILHKIEEKFGYTNGKAGNRNALNLLKRFLQEHQIPFRTKYSTWRIDLSDPEGKRGNWEIRWID
jgi:hypothetical protein